MGETFRELAARLSLSMILHPTDEVKSGDGVSLGIPSSRARSKRVCSATAAQP